MTEKAKDVQVQKRESRDLELAQDQPVFTPATDIYEKSDGILVMCDMAGVDEKHVDVTLEDDVLTITGHQDVTEPEGLELVHRGYYSGVFRRSFTLTSGVDRDKIDAKIANGVLKLILPKAEKAKPRKIQVEAE